MVIFMQFSFIEKEFSRTCNKDLRYPHCIWINKYFASSFRSRLSYCCRAKQKFEVKCLTQIEITDYIAMDVTTHVATHALLIYFYYLLFSFFILLFIYFALSEMQSRKVLYINLKQAGSLKKIRNIITKHQRSYIEGKCMK